MIRRVGEAVDGGRTEPFRFGCEGFLGELTREHAEKIAESEAKLETQHEGEAVGTGCCRRRSRTRPTATRSAARSGPERPHRGAPESALPRRRPHDPARDPRPRRADLLPPLPRPLRLRPRGPRRPVPGLPRLDRAPLRGLDGPRPARARRSARGGGALGRAPLLPRLRLGRRLSRRPDARPCAARSPASGSTSTRRATSTSTSRSGRRRARAPSAPRSRSRTRSCS